MKTSQPNRRSIRLKGYDYSQAGMYFITICCHDRIHRFGNIADGKMILNDAGKIATAEWEALKDRFHNIKQGAFVVMPNHIHFIIIITNPGMATARVAAASTDYPIRARLAPDRKTDDGESVRAGLAPAYDGNGDIVRAELAPSGKEAEYTVRAELASAQIETDDREGRPNESKYPENDPIGARLAPDRKTDDGESVRARLASAQIETDDIVRAELAPALDGKDDREGRPDEYNGVGKEGDRKGRPNESDRKITLGEIVGAYKSLVFNNCLKLAKDKGEYLGKFWQRDYYENIIRNDEAFIKISEYIINNPAKWRDDKFYNK